MELNGDVYETEKNINTYIIIRNSMLSFVQYLYIPVVFPKPERNGI